ncbi:MAG: D-aminoacylase [Desulfobacteraceae bacterium]|jgi:dihydroorotase/N-acyl-D-amino-acid deacylase|nr:D-aminoacylase [Desulfobacteraceae bacterium]
MFDLLIKGATIVDGTGAKAWVGDAAIQGGRFAALDRHIPGQARRLITAEGCMLTPGFIDIHCHSDFSLFDHPDADIKLRQGVTLEVLGNCGTSLAPLDSISRTLISAESDSDIRSWKHPLDWNSYGQYADTLEADGLSINVAGLVGHGTLRLAAMGPSDQAPSAGQLNRMKSMLSQSMDEGAAGLSTGLVYAPGCFADIRELIELAAVVSAKGGFYTSHIRNEADKIIAALEEIVRIGREAQIPVHVSHLKIAGKNNWALREIVVEMLTAARAEGLDITCDVYPYFHSCTTILALLPPWSLEGGMASLMLRLKEPRQRQRIIGGITDGITGWENMVQHTGLDKIVVSSVQSPQRKNLEGKSIAQIAGETQRDPLQLLLDLVEAENGAVSIITESMNEETMVDFLALPFAMVGSDGSPSRGRPHPRLYGTFPRVIRRLVRELGALSIEAAVHKMSGLTAQRLELKDTGILRKGYRADAVLFDPLTFGDMATYDQPRTFPRGLLATIVNGEMVIDGEKHTGARPGRFIRH